MPKYTVELSDGTHIDLEAEQQPTEEQVISALKDYGKPEQVGAVKTLLEHGAAGVGPGAAFTAAFGPGARIGAALPIPHPLGKAAASLLAGTVTGTTAALLASGAQRKAAEFLAPEFAHRFETDLAAGEQQHPVAAIAGDVLSMAPSAKLAPLALKTLPFRAGLGAGLNVALPAIQNRKLPTKDELLKEAATGAVMGTVYGEGRFGGGAPELATAAKIEPPATATAKARPAKKPLQTSINLQPTELETAERAAIDEGKAQGSNVEVVDSFTGENENEPFSQQVARPTAKGIQIKRSEFAAQLADVPPERRAQYIKSLIGEEHIHRHVSEEDAAHYWDTLTAFEKMNEIYQYSGHKSLESLNKTLPGKGINEIQMGHEAIRRQMQKFANSTPTEIAAAALKERWKLQTLDALAGVVRNAREVMGTKASQNALQILGRVDENLAAARTALIGDQSAPAAMRKIQIQKPNGSVEDAQFNGYWEGFPGTPANVGRYLPDGKVSHGLLRKGETIIGDVPTFEQWKQEQGNTPASLRKSIDPQTQAKREQFFNEIRSVPASDIEDTILDWKKQLTETFGPVKASDGGVLPREDAENYIQWGTDELERRSEQSFPGAFRKKKPDILTEKLGLVNVPHGAMVERGGFREPSSLEVESAASQHITGALERGEAPDFEAFKGDLQSKYGSGINQKNTFYSWTDAVQKHLMQATGGQLRVMLGKLGLVDDVAQALKPNEREPFLGSIPDAPPAVEMQGKLSEIEAAMQPNKWRTPSRARKNFTPEQQRRLAAIGAITDKLAKQAGGRPTWARFRKEIGPEDIANRFVVLTPAEPVPGAEGEFSQPEIQSKRAIRTFTEGEAANPRLVGEAVTAAAREHGQKVSLSKGILAVRDKVNDRMILLSAWRDGRRGPVATNPANPSGDAVKIDGKFTERYEPVHSLVLRDPVENFHQVFDSQKAFDEWFGDTGIEGTQGIRTSSFAGPEAGAARAQAGITGEASPPSAEVGALNLPKGKPVESFERELTMPRFARKSIPGEAMPPSSPKPPSERMLTPEEQLYVEAQAAEKHPPMGTMAEVSYGKPTGKIVGGKPNQPGAPLRAGLPAGDPHIPASLRKAKDAAAEQFEITMNDVKVALSRRQVKQAIPRLLEGAENAGRQMSANAKQRIVLASLDPGEQGVKFNPNPLSKERGQSRQIQREGLERRKAVIAYISAGSRNQQGEWFPNKSRIADFRAKLDIAEAKARSWMNDLNPLKRREGRKWMETVKEMQAGVEYANDHWGDTKFQATAKAYAQEIHDAIEFENANGGSTVERDNYIPGLYEGAFWSDSVLRFAPRRLLGSQYRMPKKFDNPYDAIKEGPYRLGSLDVADLAEHRINAGRRLIERDMAIRAWQALRDPATQEPVAKEPKLVMKNVTTPTGETTKEPAWLPPSPEYELIYPRRNGKPIAIRYGFASLAKIVMEPSKIDHIPLAKDALVATGMLKHGVILLWDTFHPGRVLQYAAALTGRKGMGFRGGYSAVMYRPEDMAKAVKSGIIPKYAADWALERITVNNGPDRTLNITRKDLADMMIRQGLNASKISDAMYKHAVEAVPFIGERYHKLISPYNKGLFDYFIPGLMVESAVRNFERYNQSHPNIPVSKLIPDIVRDVNAFYGNMGKQGVFKSQTFRDLNQLLFLAPMWQEGLLTKEAQFLARAVTAPLKAVGVKVPYREGMPHFGVSGSAMAAGLGAYFVLSQLINLITRGQVTWHNKEDGHKFDAWIPVGKEGKGLWLSPMAVFAETTHDLIRLGETKPRVWDRIVQMGENRLGPVGKMADILITGKSTTGERYTTTAGQLKGAAAQITPFAGAAPITFGPLSRELGHAVAPNLVAPNPPGSLPRQLFASGMGVKLQASASAYSQSMKKAQHFMEANGYKKETGWAQVMTDEPSYSKLRTAIRNDDVKGTKANLEALRKTHSDADIMKSMKLWAKHPMTGSTKHEREFVYSLSDPDLDTYSKANDERMELLSKFYDAILKY